MYYKQIKNKNKMKKNNYTCEFKQEVIEYYKTHTLQETKNKYKISIHSILTWSDPIKKLEQTKRNQRNYYNRIKNDPIYLQQRANKNKINYDNNKNKIKERNRQNYLKYKEKYIQMNKKWYIKNKHKMAKYYKEKQRYLYKTDPNHKLKALLRTRIYSAIKSVDTKKSIKTQKLIGCTIEQLRNHLESQFQSGMNWDNYGAHGWHIDHIIPCASFDLTKVEEQQKCFHYTNLQPLWAVDNLKKSTKII